MFITYQKNNPVKCVSKIIWGWKQADMLDFHVVACPSIPWLSKHNAELQERIVLQQYAWNLLILWKTLENTNCMTYIFVLTSYI